MTIQKPRTKKIVLEQREWQRLAHARMVGVVWQYGREFTVIDEDFPLPWIATGLYRLTKPHVWAAPMWVVVKFNREDVDSLMSGIEESAFTLFRAWCDASRY